MISVILTIHIIAISIALGGRIIFIPTLQRAIKEGFNERLDEFESVISISRLSDIGLMVAVLAGGFLFLLQGISLTETHWSFKLKLISIGLLLIDIGAFHIAQMRIINHFDVQMIPALKRLNLLAVILLSCMVFFATFSM